MGLGSRHRCVLRPIFTFFLSWSFPILLSFWLQLNTGDIANFEIFFIGYRRFLEVQATELNTPFEELWPSSCIESLQCGQLLEGFNWRDWLHEFKLHKIFNQVQAAQNRLSDHSKPSSSTGHGLGCISRLSDKQYNQIICDEGTYLWEWYDCIEGVVSHWQPNRETGKVG